MTFKEILMDGQTDDGRWTKSDHNSSPGDFRSDEPQIITENQNYFKLHFSLIHM